MTIETKTSDLNQREARCLHARSFKNTFAAILKTSKNTVIVTLLHAAEHPELKLGGFAICRVSILICRISQMKNQHDSKHSAHLITSQSPTLGSGSSRNG